jgi:hypothetical protein
MGVSELLACLFDVFYSRGIRANGRVRTQSAFSASHPCINVS